MMSRHPFLRQSPSRSHAPEGVRTSHPTCQACGKQIVFIVMAGSLKPMPCDKKQRYGDGRRHLVVRYAAGAHLLGKLVCRAGEDVLGFEPHWGTCPARKPTTNPATDE